MKRSQTLARKWRSRSINELDVLWLCDADLRTKSLEKYGNQYKAVVCNYVVTPEARLEKRPNGNWTRHDGKKSKSSNFSKV